MSFLGQRSLGERVAVGSIAIEVGTLAEPVMVYNSLGDESGANLLNGCWDHPTDVAIARNIRLGGSRQVQFRVDLFNVFSSVVIDARSTTLTYNSPATATTITNNQFNADGSLNTSRLTPATAGGGAATGAQPMRTVQMQLRFMF